MKIIPYLWLTIDSDDVFHHPKFQGHPKRSKKKYSKNVMSSRMEKSIECFEKWHLENIQVPLTLFIIGQQLECKKFNKKMKDLILNSKKNGGKITIGCHGYLHRCWSAFKPDKNGFKNDLELAKKIIIKFGGDLWRPWFRAPGGYIAPWMAEVLKDAGFKLDSSINPTKLLSIKSGFANQKLKFNGWKSVHLAMEKSGIIEREWLTTFFPALPTCGPALHIPVLKYLAINKWKKISNTKFANENELLNNTFKIITVYWHLLDHSKKNGAWVPPLILK